MTQDKYLSVLPVWLVVCCSVCQKINGSQSGLLPAGHEHDDRLPGGVLQDSVVGWLGHGHDPVIRNVSLK